MDLAGIVVVVVGVALYFLPTWVAASRKHHQGNSIFVINIFLGWTVLGWVIALAWAVSPVKVNEPQ